MQYLGFAQPLLQWLNQVLWQNGDAVLAALAFPDDDFTAFEINVFDPQAQPFHQAHACAVQQ